jgi:hypothetical protein
MHTTCFDHHRSSSGVSKQTLITSTHDTIRGTTHHHGTYGGTNEGIPYKMNLRTGSTAVSSAILETAEDDV